MNIRGSIRSTPTRTWSRGIAVAALSALALAGCGSADSKSSASSGNCALPGTIKISAIEDLTGPAAEAGQRTKVGMEVAAKELSGSETLKGNKLKIEFADSASNPEQAVTAMSKAASSDSVAVLGPVLSANAVRLAPAAQQAKIPYIATQSQSAGVVDAGDYIFRVTTPESFFEQKLYAYAKSTGVKSVSIVYNNTSPTLAALAKDVIPPILKKDGISLKTSQAYQAGATDFSAIVSKVLNDSPDAVVALTNASESSPLISQLNGAGFKGPVIGTQGFGGGALAGAGSKANGVIWATSFHPDADFASTKKFVSLFEKEEKEAPSNFAAEGYDAVQLLARSLGETKCYSRDGMKAAITSVAEAGFDGAMGHLKFDKRDLRVEPIIVVWKGDRPEIVNAK